MGGERVRKSGWEGQEEENIAMLVYTDKREHMDSGITGLNGTLCLLSI